MPMKKRIFFLITMAVLAIGSFPAAQAQDDALTTAPVDSTVTTPAAATVTPLVTPSPTPTPSTTPAFTPTPTATPNTSANTFFQSPGSGNNAPPAPAPTPEPENDSDGVLANILNDLGKYLLWAFIGVVALLLIFWGRAIFIRMSRLRKYAQVAMMEEQPSLNERFTSELSTLPVALLRGSITGYYEKVFSLLRRILIARGVLSDGEADSEQILDSLQNAGADGAYIDFVASITNRCDAVIHRNEVPSKEAHDKISKDLHTLLKMNPHVSHSTSESSSSRKASKSPKKSEKKEKSEE